MKIKNFLLVGVVLILGACVTTGITPDDVSKGKWVNIGVSANSNILHELDQVSIQRSGAVVTFRDKKTIEDPTKEYFPNLPEHKISVNTWEINCQAKTYRLVSTVLYDQRGKSIFSKTYTAREVAPMKIVRGSATEKQRLMVCQ